MLNASMIWEKPQDNADKPTREASPVWRREVGRCSVVTDGGALELVRWQLDHLLRSSVSRNLR
jgi:hypothetical protein